MYPTRCGPEAGGDEDLAVKAVAVRPSAFKALVGRGHAEFSSGRQQDAQEFFEHLLELVGVSLWARGPDRCVFFFKAGREEPFEHMLELVR